ncbi:esterase [mine drainage metagenome]|uniref:Esterase n=1 Tax=mine drainage metagenome TaxID=410659 RepID=T1CY20_9ZZZZ
MATYVLVPGAWLGSWAWKKILPELKKRGHEVYPITLTGMGEKVHLARKEYGIDVAVKDVINAIEYEDLNDIILLGHSFSGKVISAVADRIPERIRMLFYLDAMVPARRRTPQGGRDDMPESELKELMEESRKNGDGWKIPMSGDTIKNIAFDIKGKDMQWFKSKLTPWPLNLALEPINVSETVDRMRKAYIFCLREGVKFSPEDKKYIDSLEGEHRIIKSGHYPMITKPLETVTALLELTGQLTLL